MDKFYPIYTVENECQDCYKCVRQCPVKAIKVEGGRASVIPELCVACGHCVKICPAKAKRVRNDVGRAKQLIQSKRAVYVSLAPSWVSEFPDVSAARMVGALKKLGFAGVSETALGAQQVSLAVAKILAGSPPGVYISSACPAAVSYIQKYHPEYADCILSTMSPVLAHAKMLRQRFGDDIGVVMVSPCAAKKNEAEAHPELLDICLTYQYLKELFVERRIELAEMPEDPAAVFVPERSQEGALYPIEGGMFETVRAYSGTEKVHGVTLTGIENIGRALDNLNLGYVDDVIFVEALACPGGCVNGPCSAQKDFNMVSRMKVIANSHMPELPLRRAAEVEVGEAFEREHIAFPKHTEEQLAAALRLVGKTSKEDELNCGGCGYDTCRCFARALLRGKAEPAMCVSYMRKQAQKKANGLLRCIPSGVVIVDADMKIVECNERFANMFDEGTACAYEAKPGLNGALIRKIVPFHELFESSLRSGQDIHRDTIKVEGRLLNITIFNIDLHQVVGAVIFDVTQTETRREQIARRAKEVINRNLATVQEIACKLGEHMADTEILLRDIADDYTDEAPKDN